MAVDNGGARRGITAGAESCQLAQVGVDLFPGAVEAPAPQIVVDGGSGAILIGQIPAGPARAQDIKDTVHDAPDLHRARPTTRFGGRNQRGQECPLGVAQVAGIDRIHWSCHEEMPFATSLRISLRTGYLVMAFLFLHTLSEAIVQVEGIRRLFRARRRARIQ